MRVPLSLSALLLAVTPSFALAPAPHTRAVPQANIRHAAIKSHKTATVRHESVQGMAPERATQIQTALIKAGYLSGEPSGTWDAASIAAMQKLQGDNGWQTKLTPDSRAIIKLGLGPQSDTPPASTQAAN